jgi:hypothetical protein
MCHVTPRARLIVFSLRLKVNCGFIGHRHLSYEFEINVIFTLIWQMRTYVKYSHKGL